MRNLARWISAFLFALACTIYLVPEAAHACPPGFIPNAAGTPGVECIPHTDGGGSSNSGASTGMQWETRWGAFAFDGATSIVGQGSKMTSRGRAKKAALADCQSQGGTACKVEFTYYNHCAAYAEGKLPNGYWTHYYYSDNTLNSAIGNAIKGCSARGAAQCEAVRTDCSRPQRVQ